MNLLRYKENDIAGEEKRKNEREIESKPKEERRFRVLESVSTVEMCNH